MKNVSDNFSAESYVLSEYAMKNITFHLKKKVDLHMTFSFTFIKNSSPPSCVPLRTLQLLSETFFSKLNRNIHLVRLKWNTLYIVTWHFWDVTWNSRHNDEALRILRSPELGRASVLRVLSFIALPFSKFTVSFLSFNLPERDRSKQLVARTTLCILHRLHRTKKRSSTTTWELMTQIAEGEGNTQVVAFLYLLFLIWVRNCRRYTLAGIPRGK